MRRARSIAVVILLGLVAAPLRPARAEEPDPSRQRRLRQAALAMAVVGGAGVVAAIGLGAGSRVAFNDFDREVRRQLGGVVLAPSYVPTAAQRATRSRADALNSGAIGAAVTGAILVDAALLVYLLFIRSDRPASTARWHLVPAGDGARAALRWEF